MSGSRLYPERPFLAASVAVLREGKILLAARANPPGDNVFSLPGGLVEVGETLAEAALRELREEVGIEASIFGVIGPVEVVERDGALRVKRHFVVVAHVARWLAGEPCRSPEALDLRWVDEADIAAFGREGGVAVTPGLAAILAGAFRLERSRPEMGADTLTLS